MYRRSSGLLLLFVLASPLLAQSPGSASGKGTIERFTSSGDTERMAFAPKFSYAYVEGTGAKKSTWIVLTEKAPPLAAWAGVKDANEARRVWCEKEKTPFVALKLDAQDEVDLYFLCPADGGLNTEMLSTANGLDSIVVQFKREGQKLAGTLKTGTGSCPGPDGAQAYCTPTGDYAFTAPLVK